MSRGNVFASYTFRFTFAYITGLSFAVFVLLAVVYAFFSYSYSQDVHSTISKELEGVQLSFEEGGVAGVERFFNSTLQRGHFTQYFYMLTDENHNKLAGNLDAWPEYTRYRGGWLSFEFDILQGDDYEINLLKPKVGAQMGAGNRRDFVGRSLTMANGYHILVARHYSDVINTIELVIGILVRGMLVTIVLGTIAGALISRAWLRRVEQINDSMVNIMMGDMNQRIAIDGRSSNDIQRLSINFNEMLDQLQESMEGVRRVSDNIAHDLRTPLTRLRNKLESFGDKVGVEHESEMQGLISEADSLLNTFSALLRITRIESAKQRESFAQIDAAMILADVVEFYEPLADEKHQTISFDADFRPIIFGDRDMLFQTWVNLVDNAIKYTPEGGAIKVSIRKGEGELAGRACRYATILVEDDGPGIPEDEREKAFKRFYRVEASRGLAPGNGLGLSLIAAVVSLHRGSIALEDSAPGLRVRLNLPLYDRRSSANS
ncbi:signal transduction histidine kinase [Sinobacterium caligoides]|uniref:histidine kinase n=1 Tax=Sinobacterium caligoides TaxID=933926 RepID=A0A3N2DZE5_9GAMM|nr:HAMP domain-containing sensor histidine kinase [Sinobacterium caligoides]ROS05246.1 signal transduction histidine kinase [Sinobacterium caligoides]